MWIEGGVFLCYDKVGCGGGGILRFMDGIMGRSMWVGRGWAGG